MLRNEAARDRRRELAKYRMELNDSSTIVLHQNNVKENDSVKSIYRQKLIKIVPRIYNLLPKMTSMNMPNSIKKRLLPFLVVLCTLLTIYFTVTSKTAIIQREVPPTDRITCPTASEREMTNLECPCSDDIDYDDLVSVEANNSGKNESTSISRTSSASKSRFLLKRNGSDVQASVLSRLWQFTDAGDQLLYLYEILLNKEWISNRTNTDILRRELAKYRMELNDSSTIVLHQNNVKENDSVKSIYRKKSIKIVSRIHNLLPKSDPLPQGRIIPSCAVVGNSGSMLNSSCGKKIDKHDFVFRCNVAPLPPFERDAGIKSNFSTMNPSIIRKRYRSLKDEHSIKQFNDDISLFDGVIALPCFHLSMSDALKAIRTYKGKNPKMVCMNSKHFRSVVDFWWDRKVTTKKLSSGFYVATTAIQLCDEIELYGFWPFDSRFGSDRIDIPYHYFDNASAKKVAKAHSMDKEFSILTQLHNLGIVHLNVGSCT